MKCIRIAPVVVCLVLCTASTGADETGTSAGVYTKDIFAPEMHSAPTIQGPNYSAAGEPLDPLGDWSHSWGGAGYGEIEGRAQSWAEVDELKSYIHLYLDKTTTDRVKYHSSTECSYKKTVQFENPTQPEIWCGEGSDHRVELEFRVTGNIQENDISGAGIRSDVDLDIWSDNENPPELEEVPGWWPLIGDNYAGDNDVDSAGNYDKTATYEYCWLDENWNDGCDYNGEPIPFTLRLRLTAEEGDIDALAEGETTMDFTSTCVLESARLYEDAGETQTLLVEFDGDGNVTGGTQQSDWIMTPEPGSVVLLGLGGLALLRRKR